MVLDHECDHLMLKYIVDLFIYFLFSIILFPYEMDMDRIN